jgi:large subunit ribosomal protein L4
LRAALSVHAQRGSVAVVDGAQFDEPSTSKAAAALRDWDAARPVLVLLAAEEEAPAKSFRNIARVGVLPATEAGVADVMGAASVVLSKAGLDALVEAAEKSDRGARS